MGYLGLGALAGLLGNAASALVSPRFQVVIGIGLGGVIIVTGIRALYGRPVQVPHWLRSITEFLMPSILKKIRGIPTLQGLVLGVGSILLPCGWLYSYLIAASATGSLVTGISVMAAFWAGTVPALLIGSRIWAAATGPIKARSAQLQALLLILLGIVTIGTKLRYVTFTSNTPVNCHSTSDHSWSTFTRNHSSNLIN
jgi:sulfite exporter TauE/SafE